METQKIIETSNYTYIIKYNPTKPNKKGVWFVKRISSSSPFDITTATVKNNPSHTIDSVMTDYENLVYNYLSDIE